MNQKNSEIDVFQKIPPEIDRKQPELKTKSVTSRKKKENLANQNSKPEESEIF